MHIHGNSMTVNAANFYSATQEEKAAAAQRAASVRKKLIKSASDIEGAATPEETLMIGDRRQDILAGKLNHTQTIGVTYGYGSRREVVDSIPNYVCACVEEIRMAITAMLQTVPENQKVRSVKR